MVVNGRYNYTGMSPGKYETLDLLLPLFVGGVTNYKAVSEITNLNTGFTGKLFIFISKKLFPKV